MVQVQVRVASYLQPWWLNLKSESALPTGHCTTCLSRYMFFLPLASLQPVVWSDMAGGAAGGGGEATYSGSHPPQMVGQFFATAAQAWVLSPPKDFHARCVTRAPQVWERPMWLTAGVVHAQLTPHTFTADEASMASVLLTSIQACTRFRSAAGESLAWGKP